MNKLQIKNLLSKETVPTLRNIAKNLQVCTSGLLKEDILNELACTLVACENDNQFKVNNELINELKGKKVDNIIDMIKNVNLEVAPTLEESDLVPEHQLQQDSVPRQTYSMEFDPNISGIVKLIDDDLQYANPKDSEGKYKYSFNTKPSTILKDVAEDLCLTEHITQYMFIKTFGFPTLEERRLECNYSETEIENKYNEEMVALRQIFINASMASKEPSEKQIKALTDCTNNVKKNVEKHHHLSEVVKELNKLRVSIAMKESNALEVKLAIEKGYKALYVLPMTEGQEKFIKAIRKLGLGKNEVTDCYGNAREFINKYQEEFNTHNLTKTFQTYGVPVTLDTIKGFSKEQRESFDQALKTFGVALEQAYKFTGMNIFKLIEKLNSLSNVEKLNLQTACATKEFEYVCNVLSK